MNIKHEYPQYIAEFIGTFFLVFFGTGAIIMEEALLNSVPSFVIPFVFGGTVMVMIYAVGHISGAHFNPAVTIAFWIIKKFPLKRVIGYCLSQTLGAILAGGIHYLLWKYYDHGYGMTTLSINTAPGFLIEVILSFALMFVIVSVATDSRAVGELAGIAIGGTVTLCAIIGGPLTGASMNPARSIGPAIWSGQFSELGVYILAPIFGCALGAIIYNWIKCQKDIHSDHGCC